MAYTVEFNYRHRVLSRQGLGNSDRGKLPLPLTSLLEDKLKWKATVLLVSPG